MGKRLDNVKRPALKKAQKAKKPAKPKTPPHLRSNQKTTKLADRRASDVARLDAVSVGFSDLEDADASQQARIIEMPPNDRRAVRREERRKAKKKAKAEKAYAKAYGDDTGKKSLFKSKKKAASANASSSASTNSDGGPRAALYKGKMGASQKKSSKMQSSAKRKATKAPKATSTKKAKDGIAAVVGKVSSTKISKPSLSMSAKTARVMHKLVKPLLAVGIVALFAVALYGPAQQYYVQMRETDRLQAEYAAVMQRSDTLKSEIDTLQTDEGVEDRAHEDLGYIKQGEMTASVKGLELERNENFSSNVAPGSITAPETWYSPVLDVFFGYAGA